MVVRRPVIRVRIFLGAFSATSLRCGTDGDSSYVEVVSAPQSISQNTRALSELCAFGFVGDEDG